MKLVRSLKLNTCIKYIRTITLVFMSRPLRSKVLSKFTFTSCVCVEQHLYLEQKFSKGRCACDICLSRR